jgi:hypothetical protein
MERDGVCPVIVRSIPIHSLMRWKVSWWSSQWHWVMHGTSPRHAIFFDWRNMIEENRTISFTLGITNL